LSAWVSAEAAKRLEITFSVPDREYEAAGEALSLIRQENPELIQLFPDSSLLRQHLAEPAVAITHAVPAPECGIGDAMLR
jgi:hypothetical protein